MTSRRRRLESARRHYLRSLLITRRARREARRAWPNFGRWSRVVVQHQVAQVAEARRAVPAMLAEQDIESQADALLNSPAFTTSVKSLERMLDSMADRGPTDWDRDLERLTDSLVNDAGRAAESIDVVTRPWIYHTRYVNTPCCSRCAVLSGLTYRWSTGFERHPNCKCVMIPTTLANPATQRTPMELFEAGLIHDLSRADAEAIRLGADIGQVVNIRRDSGTRKPTKRGARRRPAPAGSPDLLAFLPDQTRYPTAASGLKPNMSPAGETLSRLGRPTPAAILRMGGDDRELVLQLLAEHGFIR